jgi:glycosyltransferase involved in cell wall biosynthesis
LGTFFEKKGHSVFFLGTKGNSQFQDPRQYYVPDSRKFYTDQNIQFFMDFIKSKNIEIVINQNGTSPKNSKLAYCCRQLSVALISVIHNAPLGRIKHFNAAYADKFQKKGLSWLLPVTEFLLIKKILLWLYKQKYGRHYKNLCKKSDRVILLSESLKDELFFFTGKKDTVIGIPNPLPFEADDSSSVISKKNEIVYVGRIDFTQKRVDLLLQIWSKLYKKFSNWSFRVVGDGAQLAEVKLTSKKLGLENIYFEGFKDPQSYYKESSLFCMTSTYEGFPMVLVEAMQYGVVPFAFNSFLSVTDIIDDQVNGILIPPFDTGKYAAELARLMRDEKLRSRFALKAVEKSKDFNIEKIGAVWETLFEDIQSGKKSVNI